MGPLGVAARKELFRRLYEKPDTDPIQFRDPQFSSLPRHCFFFSCIHAHHIKVLHRFLEYLHNAHRDLYKKEGPFGAKPVQMAFELLFLRPPSVRSWAKTLGLRS
jgi:hypothetical protein